MESLISPKIDSLTNSKPKKTLVCVNVLTDVDNSVYLSHTQMWYRMGRDFPKDKFFNYTPRRTSIDNARNYAAKIALEQECDYLLFIDDDMILHEMTYKSMRENIERPGIDVVMACTYIRGYPFRPMFFKATDIKNGRVVGLDNYDEFEKDIDPKTHCVKVDAIGCACVLIKCDLIKKLEPPYFVTMPNMTEDVYFCLKAYDTLGYGNVNMLVDCGVPTGHLGDKEIYSHLNIQAHREFAEKVDPSLKKKDESGDRGDSYLAKIGEPLLQEVK